MKKRNKFASCIALSSIILTIGAATAGEGKWAQEHPRRAQVNERLENQNKRISREVAEGDMSQQKANRLRSEDRQIRQEERAMARQNGGHITKQEQQTLNQQENAISKQIGK